MSFKLLWVWSWSQEDILSLRQIDKVRIFLSQSWDAMYENESGNSNSSRWHKNIHPSLKLTPNTELAPSVLSEGCEICCSTDEEKTSEFQYSRSKDLVGTFSPFSYHPSAFLSRWFRNYSNRKERSEWAVVSPVPYIKKQWWAFSNI